MLIRIPVIIKTHNSNYNTNINNSNRNNSTCTSDSILITTLSNSITNLIIISITNNNIAKT